MEIKIIMDGSAILIEAKNENQRTLINKIYLKGIGLHTGNNSSVVIKPAKADSGIIFIRKDLNPPVVIKANVGNICSTMLRTSIGTSVEDNDNPGVRKPYGCISTVEHLMSALWGAGIDNAVIEVYGDEIPAMDGSASLFYEAIEEAGVKELKHKRKYIEILKPLSVEEGNTRKPVSDSTETVGNLAKCGIAIYPSDDFEISYVIDFKHPLVSSGSFDMKIDDINFYREISKARTFGFLKDVEQLKKNGLALGGSLDNALVLDEKTVLNGGGLRYEDEFIRHKVLDLIGDMYLSGYRIKGRIIASKTGHDMNSRLVKKIGEHLVSKVDGSHEPVPEDINNAVIGIKGGSVGVFA